VLTGFVFLFAVCLLHRERAGEQDPQA